MSPCRTSSLWKKDLGAGDRCRFKCVTQGKLVRIETGADVLDVDHQDTQLPEHAFRWMSARRRVTVDAVDVYARGAID